MATVSNELRIQTVCLLLLTAFATGAALYFLSPVLIPFVLAVFLMYCLTPVIELQMQRLRIRRTFALINTLLLAVIVLILLWLLIWTSVATMAANASDYEAQFRQLLERTADRLPLERLGIERSEFNEILKLPRDSMGGLLGQIVSAITGILSQGLLVLIFLGFLIAGASKTRPDGLPAQIEDQIKRYMLAKVFVSSATGLLVGVTLALCGVRLAMVFGVLAFLLNFIPNIGSVVATLLPLPIIVLSPEMSGFARVAALAVPTAIQFVVGNVVEPRIMGRSLDLHPVVVLLGLIFFGMIWGIVGMLLATPIVAMIKIVLERIDVTAPVADILAGRLETRRAKRAPPSQPARS
jgi:AI-2 transport protein TqsA